MPTLFDPIMLGDIALPNRIVMSPMTRCRASAGRVPNDLMREYYTQRASAGLILTEATSISPQGVGYPDTPGLWTAEQTDAWKPIVDSVHTAGGRIVAQLWHVGRISHPYYLNGELPVSASAIAPLGQVRVHNQEQTPFVVPRALETGEISGVVETFLIGAENARRAGFDGVEIHGANGYLPDQFLRDGTNKRTDQYGGSVENRARFLLDVTDAAISVWGPRRVGVHLSPRNMEGYGAIDSDPSATYGYVAEELGKRGIAFLFCRESVVGATRYTPEIKRRFGGPVIANEAFTPELAQQVLDAGEADAVSWAKLYLANPDLPKRIQIGGSYNEPIPATFYAQGPQGYTDYPALP